MHWNGLVERREYETCREQWQRCENAKKQKSLSSALKDLQDGCGVEARTTLIT